MYAPSSRRRGARCEISSNCWSWRSSDLKVQSTHTDRQRGRVYTAFPPRSSADELMTPYEQFLTIDGRRWRRSDPTIPENLRQQLVNELMSARRAVAAAGNARDLKRARRRVQNAKLALGERGRAWWLAPSTAARNLRIDAAIQALLHGRSEGASICPSEAARVVGVNLWRELMNDVRVRAAMLSRNRRIRITRHGRTVVGHQRTGVVRYQLRRR